MAISGKKVMFPGVFTAVLMAVLLVVATEGAVTVYNAAKIPVDGESLKVEAGITQAEQKIDTATPVGGLMSVDVKDGDALVLLPGVGNSPAVKVVPVPEESGDSDEKRVESALPPDFDRYGPGYAEPRN